MFRFRSSRFPAARVFWILSQAEGGFAMTEHENSIRSAILKPVAAFFMAFLLLAGYCSTIAAETSPQNNTAPAAETVSRPDPAASPEAAAQVNP
jgi:hypothetical protein